MRDVGVDLFDDVEVLDFAGSFEVFSTASRFFRREHPGVQPPSRPFTVGAARASITARQLDYEWRGDLRAATLDDA